MILRLIPNLIKKTKTIIGARNCIGKGTKNDTCKDKLNSGLEVLSILTSCALEDAVITADSMRSRGYVDDNHTSYHTYQKQKRDIVIGLFFAVTAVATVICIVKGFTQMQFLPAIIFPQVTVFTYIGIISYSLFLSIPLIIEFSEEITWHILKSKI
jgi:energy-coupling factor transport system permease protein